jgi:hypothetical protein
LRPALLGGGRFRSRRRGLDRRFGRGFLGLARDRLEGLRRRFVHAWRLGLARTAEIGDRIRDLWLDALLVALFVRLVLAMFYAVAPCECVFAVAPTPVATSTPAAAPAAAVLAIAVLLAVDPLRTAFG